MAKRMISPKVTVEHVQFATVSCADLRQTYWGGLCGHGGRSPWLRVIMLQEVRRVREVGDANDREMVVVNIRDAELWGRSSHPRGPVRRRSTAGGSLGSFVFGLADA